MHVPLLKKLPLKYKVALCFSSIIILALSTLWLLTTDNFKSNLQLQADELGLTLAEQTADSIIELVLANDLLGLNVVISQLATSDSISHVTVFDVDNNILARSGESTLNSVITYSYNADISLQNAIAGSVLIELNSNSLRANINNIQLLFWGILAFGLMLAISTAFALTSHITQPLESIVKAFSEPDEGFIKLDENRQDEVSELETVCKALLGKYQKIRSHQLSLSGLGNSGPAAEQSSKIMTSLLIVKVVNVNTAIEFLHPSTLSKLLNEYNFYLKQAAKLYGGTVQRFTGDSALVSFDTISCGEDHSFNAVCCAQLFLRLTQNLSRMHHAKKAQALQFKLAIHSGETFFSIDPNNKNNLALLGKSLETSFFLCTQSQPGQLLISETTYTQAGADKRLRSLGSFEITMLADNMSFMAYLINPEMGSYSELLQKQSLHILPTGNDDET
ncbi:MAG: adenylate/guanylate cyclase domain-containing protein [Pseudohongiellaceae bacterium]